MRHISENNPLEIMRRYLALLMLLLFPALSFAQGPLNNGGRHQGSIFVAGEQDSWTFAATTGNRLLFRIGEVSGDSNFSPRLRVYGPGGQLLVTAADSASSTSNDAVIEIVAQATGNFTATMDAAAGFGSYALNYLKLPGDFIVSSADQGGELVNGINVSGTITVGDLDPWSFQVTSGERLLLRVGEVTGGDGFSPRLRLYGPDGGLIVTSAQETASSANESLAEIVATTTGKYTVVLDSFYLRGTGTYRLDYLKIPGAFTVSSTDQGGLLTEGGARDGTINTGDIDGWNFQATMGERVLLRVAELTGGNDFVPRLRVFGPTGELIKSVFENSPGSANEAFAEIVPTATGTYTVVIDSYGLGSGGTYRLQFLKVPGVYVVAADDHGGPLAGSGRREGTITIGDLDTWTFQANAGNTITIQLQKLTGTNFSPLLKVYGPQGEVISSVTQASLAQATFTATAAGIYTVVAANDNYGSSGNYGITFSGIPALPQWDPPLRISREGSSSILLTWQPSLSGEVLQQSTTLVTASWQNVTTVPEVHGVNFELGLPIDAARKFFRLRTVTP